MLRFQLFAFALISYCAWPSIGIGQESNPQTTAVPSTVAPPTARPFVFPTQQISCPMIFLNGENITGIKDQELKNVEKIVFDKEGNINIYASNYEPQRTERFRPVINPSLK